MCETHCHHHGPEPSATIQQSLQAQAGEYARENHHALHSHLGAACCGGLCSGHEHLHQAINYATQMQSLQEELTQSDADTKKKKEKAKRGQTSGWLLQWANVPTSAASKA